MNCFPSFVIAAFAFFAAFAVTPGALANTLATWTDTTADHAWETPANWDINQVPNNSSFDVNFATLAAPTCNLSSQFQIGRLLSVNGTSLNLLPGSLLAIASPNGMNNNGTIVVNTTAANVITTLRFDASASITGAGSIRLNGVNPSDALLSAANVTVTNGANHTIRGRGNISMTPNNTVLLNNGTLNADQAAGALRLSLSNSLGNQNNAIIEATSGGLLYFDQGFLDQRGGGSIVSHPGVFNGPATTVHLGDSTTGHSPVIEGGTFTTPSPSNGAKPSHIFADSVFLDGCTNVATTEIPAGGLLAILGKGLTNNGDIHLSSSNANSPATLRFDASATLTGRGFVFLEGVDPGSNRILVDGVTMTIGPQQVIKGTGDIVANNGVLINNGGIGAGTENHDILRIFLSNAAENQNNGDIDSDATLSLEEGRIDQTAGGKLSAGIHNGILKIGGAQTVTVVGGTFAVDDTGFFHGTIQGIAAVLAGEITNLGFYEIPSNGFTYIAATKLTNNGTITLAQNTSLLRFDTSTSIAGSGTVILANNATIEINNNVPNNVVVGAGHTIKGNGTLQIDNGSTLTNHGIIAPGESAGALNFSGDLQLGFPSDLSFEIGGINQGIDYDLLHKTDNGVLTLKGKLTLRLLNGFTPASTDSFTIITTQSMLAGAFTNVANGGRLNTSDGSGSFVVNYSGNNVVLSDFGPPLAPSRLLNIATRLRVLTGDNALIAGFIITGTDAKKVLVRGLGPSLTNQGVPETLPDPTLELHNSSGATLALNNNWKDSQQSEIQNSGIPSTDDLESAIVATLGANNSAYTAILRGNNNTTGNGLVEVYDLDQAANSKLANISSRGRVGLNDNVMIGGVIVGSNSTNAANVAVRALGPSLSSAGIQDAVPDPILELRDHNGNLIAVNDNWRETQPEQIAAANLAPADDRESAMIVTLAAGNYTAVVHGVNSATGVALVEVYNLP